MKRKIKISRLHFKGEGKKMVTICSKYPTMATFEGKINLKGLWVAIDEWMSEGGPLFTKLMSAFLTLSKKQQS